MRLKRKDYFIMLKRNLQMLQLTRLRAPVFPSKGEKLGCHINNLSFLLFFPHLHEVEETDETGTVEKASGSVQLSISPVPCYSISTWLSPVGLCPGRGNSSAGRLWDSLALSCCGTGSGGSLVLTGCGEQFPAYS